MEGRLNEAPKGGWLLGLRLPESNLPELSESEAR